MTVRLKIFSAIVAFCCLLLANGGKTKEIAMSIQLTSAVFSNGQPIPKKYAGEGMDFSPSLSWSGAPAETKSFALIVEDPDAPAGVWTHWVLYNLPATVTALDENVPKTESLPNGTKQGVNDFKKVGYNGPMPPPGKLHHYFFKIYALDATLNLKPGVTRKDLFKAMDCHVIGEGQLMGTYRRN